MMLTDLEPRWFALEADGPAVGLSFDCPHCGEQRLGILFHHAGATAMAEEQYIRAHYTGAPDRYIWELASGSSFADLTLSPSIDASASGHWHGFITNGAIV